MAFRILIHAFRMVFGNLGPAVRISVPVIALSLFGAVMFPLDAAEAQAPADRILSAPFLLFLVLSLIAVLWVAVAWHRFCLTEEYPGAVLPAFHGDRMLAYFGWTLLVILIGAAVSIPAFVLIGLVTAAVQAPVVGAMLGLVWVAVLLWILQRVSMVLPAAALGTEAAIGKSWELTKPLSGTIFVVTVLFTLFSFVIGLIPVPIFAVSPLAGAIANVAIQWLNMMIGLSILTTVYGICVEGRAVE